MNQSPITVVVSGKPVPKGRGRAAVLPNGRPVIFTPKNTRKWEADARQLARQKMGERPPFECPLQIVVTAVFIPSQSWPQWKREMALAGNVRHTAKPDGDNILKCMKDALNGVVYLDDAQMSKSGVVKKYGDRAMVVAKVTPLPGHPSQIKRRPEHGGFI